MPLNRATGIDASTSLSTFGYLSPSVTNSNLDLSALISSIRSNFTISGGGTITYDTSGYLSWTTRFIVMQAGSRNTNFATAGYFDINMPAAGTAIIGLGGSSSRLVETAGIQINVWESLYYIMPIGTGQTSVASNFRIIGYTENHDIPPHWVRIATRNGDVASGAALYLNNGIKIRGGEKYINQDRSSVTPSFQNIYVTPYSGTDTAFLEIGTARTGDGYSYIDLIGDATYTDYGLRIIRHNTGANAPSEIISRGTGGLYLTAFDSASMTFKTANTDRMTLDSTGNLYLYRSDASTSLTISNSQAQAAARYPQLAIQNWAGSVNNGHPVVELINSNGSSTVPTAITSGQILGGYNFWGYNGTANVAGARIEAVAEATFSGTVGSTYLKFVTRTGTTEAERMRIDSTGQVGIGSTTLTGKTLTISKNITGATSSFGIVSDGTVQSDVTTLATSYYSGLSTVASAFTLASLSHYTAQQGTFGATSAVTNQYGFFAGSTLTGATNNYAFFGNIIASGSSRWNAYMANTAPNYFGGQTTVGSTSLTLGASSVAQQFGVVSTAASNIAEVIRGAASQTGDLTQWQSSAGSVLSKVDSSGNIGVGGTPKVRLQTSSSSTSPAPTLGTASGALYITNNDTAYGLLAGVTATGTAWLQVQRTDATATAYDLFLQPSGGNVGIGAAPSASYIFDIQKTASGASTGARVYNSATAASSGARLDLQQGAVNTFIDSVSNTTGRIGTSTTHPLSIYTNNTERVSVASGGAITISSATSLSGTDAPFKISSPSTAQGLTSGITLYSTFTGTADNGPRRTADIIAGYSGGAWGNEYLAFNVGTGAQNDTANLTTERMRISGLGIVKYSAAIAEAVTVSATAAATTVTYDVMTNKNVLYYTTNATANWTFNVRGNSTTTLNTLMDTGQSLTVVFMNTNGATAYYASAFQIDGTAVTPKWFGGSAPTAGNASSIDVYTYNIIKTGSATYTVLASLNKFA